MALWQADFYLAPQAAVISRGGEVTSEEACETAWWEGAWLSADYRERLQRFTAPRASWSESLEAWGEEEGSRIDIWRERGHIHQVLIRVDLRAPDLGFISGVLEFATANECVLVRSDGWITEPGLDAFVKALAGSPAFRFVENPRRFLSRLAVGGIDDA
jgi:hypothetical protein